MTLGERIAAERAKAGLSQRALADAAGLRQAQISRLEAGERDAPFATLQRIALALGLPVWRLVRPL